MSLRTGITTGTCAAAAAKAALLRLLTGCESAEITTPLPDGGRVEVAISRIQMEGDAVRAVVVKDAGDDPDITNGHEIHAVVRLTTTGEPLAVSLEGGIGVGTVTLPGLPVLPGEPAINPAPRRQIAAAVREAVAMCEGCAAAQATGVVTVRIEVPEGERLAAGTMNPRLGIEGGISILGTHGIVKPYSHDSWKASIEEALDVAKATGVRTPVLTTGRRSEKFHLRHHPDTPDQALVQAADFFSFAMQAAAQRSFPEVLWAVFPGKLVKQAQGLAYTHAKTHPVDFTKLATTCANIGVAKEQVQLICTANTARQVFNMLEGTPHYTLLVRELMAQASRHAETFSGNAVHVGYRVYAFDGSLTASS